jgi:hypothetical protein
MYAGDDKALNHEEDINAEEAAMNSWNTRVIKNDEYDGEGPERLDICTELCSTPNRVKLLGWGLEQERLRLRCTQRRREFAHN